jgi:hypothetical protein
VARKHHTYAYPRNLTDIKDSGANKLNQVADDLAAANISVILSENRPAPDVFRDSDAVVGPPLTRSVASYLREAGVTFALAIFETGKHPLNSSP